MAPVVLLALAVGGIFAFAFAAFIRSTLVDAHGHGNNMLPFLHVAWIITIVSFMVQTPVFFG